MHLDAEPVPLPTELMSGGIEATLVWNWPGVQSTYRLALPTGAARFVKVGRRDRSPNGPTEADRLSWLSVQATPFTTPQVIDIGHDDDVDWIMTSEIPGRNATEHRWMTEDPGRLVDHLGRALREFHDTLPTIGCPFDSTISELAHQVEMRRRAGVIKASDLHPEHADMGVDGAVDRLMSTAPDIEEVVVCHGDYCFPNVMFTGDEVTGLLDVGELGVASYWWDVAVGAWSTTWNVGPGYEERFYAAYGVEPDHDRIAWYRLLYDLVS